VRAVRAGEGRAEGDGCLGPPDVSLSPSCSPETPFFDLPAICGTPTGPLSTVKIFSIVTHMHTYKSLCRAVPCLACSCYAVRTSTCSSMTLASPSRSITNRTECSGCASPIASLPGRVPGTATRRNSTRDTDTLEGMQYNGT
jgi:hypothetical protein